MALWIFKCFLSEHGRDVIDEWYRGLSPRAQRKFDTILEYLRDTPHTQWSPHLVFPLADSDGIYEIRFKVRNVLYRPLEFFGPDRGEFTLLIPAREQGNDFVPRNAKALAEERKHIVLMDRRRAHECDF
jgi:hypothetical protein